MTDTTATETPTVVGEFRTPRGRPALMSMRPGTNDWNTLNACMTEDEYGLRSFNGDGWAVEFGADVRLVSVTAPSLDAPAWLLMEDGSRIPISAVLLVVRLM